MVDRMNVHTRGCQGREYTCSCGYDDQRDAEIQRLRAEVERLRKIVSDCAEATGAFVAPTCSLEFMEGLPNEIRLSRAGLVAEERERAAQIAEKQPAPFIDTVWGQCSLAIAAAIRQAGKDGGAG